MRPWNLCHMILPWWKYNQLIMVSILNIHINKFIATFPATLNLSMNLDTFNIYSHSTLIYVYIIPVKSADLGGGRLFPFPSLFFILGWSWLPVLDQLIATVEDCSEELFLGDTYVHGALVHALCKYMREKLHTPFPLTYLGLLGLLGLWRFVQVKLFNNNNVGTC